MQRIFIFLLIIATLWSCSRGSRTDGISAGGSDTLATQLPTLSADSSRQRKAETQAELKYYLDRHDVQDEGFEMVAAYATHGDSLMTSLLPQEPVSIWSIGRWQGIQRRGYGLSSDSLGRVVLGEYEADTLRSGIRIDSAGIYAGDFSHGLAGGHGAYKSVKGLYYEGAWSDDCRNGFGISVAPYTHVRAGEWSQDKYLGERMHYTSDRIYGIDISRYQHGKGRKKYPIHWDRVRISHLGTLSKKRVSGTVDYPVSFCFIKSTEGVSVRNPFFMTDYQQARRRGIPVGAYHFFSTKRTGTAQAQYFINSTLFRHGDLPPVLDVEPSAGQIAQMGGADALFRNVRAWLQAVERRTGVKPILYVNQKFVNNYLVQAPDIKRDYQVWIARYGEYKPDVKLAIWQLCPDGRVTGIRGEVDINVFNGYKSQFEEFLENETIK